MNTEIHPKTHKASPLIAEEVYAVIAKHKERLDGAIVYDRDFEFDYFGFKTLERSYLLKMHDETAERPQHMYMRVAVGIHGDDMDSVVDTYNGLSQGYYSHASPTLFNACSPMPQLSLPHAAHLA